MGEEGGESWRCAMYKVSRTDSERRAERYPGWKEGDYQGEKVVGCVGPIVLRRGMNRKGDDDDDDAWMFMLPISCVSNPSSCAAR